MRSDRRRRVALIAALAAAVLLVVAVAWWWAARDEGVGTPDPASPAPGAGPSQLAVLSITGSSQALLAVVGANGATAPAALVLPPGTTVVAPGQGESTAEEVQALPGEGMRIAVSNSVGAWATTYGVTDLGGLSAAVDRAGGLTVDLPDPVTLDGEVVGPGVTTMTGSQVAAFLRDAGDETSLRWLLVLDALLGAPVLEQDDLLESDDAIAFLALLADTGGASPELMPVQVVGGTVSIAAQPETDELVGLLFGTTIPTPVVVENGSGEAGAGELVGAHIIPLGFRIVLSGNAESFRYQVTQITATGDEHVDDAEAIRDALGTGEVQVTQVPSGLADVVIVTGKDLEA